MCSIRRRPPESLGLCTLLLLVLWHASPCFSAPASVRQEGLFLVFWEPEDVTEPLGAVRFGAEPLRNEGRAVGYPDMQYGCEVPREDGTTGIYGWRVRNWQEPDNRRLEVIRCATPRFTRSRPSNSRAGQAVRYGEGT